MSKDQVELLISTLHKEYGKDSIINLKGRPAPMERISSGCLSLDLALGGGYPRGRFIEIYGGESAGKTSLSLHAIAEAQKQGHSCAFIDVEHALDLDYAQAIGIDINEEKLLLAQPDSAEQALNILDQMIRSGALALVVVDSTNALVPQAELEGEAGDSLPGLQARLISKACRKSVGICNITGTTVLWISQLRMKIGVMFGNPEVAGSGNAMKYYTSQRLDIRRKETVKDGDIATANTVKVKVVKNKVGPPYRTAEFNLEFGKGIDKARDILELATTYNIVDKAGAWYSYKGDRLGQGKEGVLEALSSNEPLMEEIRGKTFEVVNEALHPKG